MISVRLIRTRWVRAIWPGTYLVSVDDDSGALVCADEKSGEVHRMTT